MRSSRRAWLAGSAATAALLAVPRVARAASPGRWIIEPSEAHDAIRLIGYGGYPPGTPEADAKDVALEALAARIPASAMKHVVDRFGHGALGFLDLFEALLVAWDYARPHTLADLRPAVRTAAPHADKWFAQSAGDLERIVDALIAGGFSAFWHERNLPRATADAARLRRALGDTDPFTPASRVLGMPVGEDVTLLVQGYASAATRWLAGRRFYTDAAGTPADILQWVIHGIVRDGYAALREDAEVNRAVDALSRDRFVTGTLKARNASHEYYRDLRAYVHGSCLLVLQHLASGPAPLLYWHASGIHALAHVLYAVLVEERYASTAHGPFRATLLRLIGPGGPLAPGRVGPTYARLIGKPLPEDGWPPMPDPNDPR